MTEVKKKYGDIMDREWGSPEFFAKHPRMALGQRAKIFAPFAALRGHDEAIEGENMQTLRAPRTVLSEEEQDALSRKLAQVKTGAGITVTWFASDGSDWYTGEEIGYYRTLTGTAVGVDALRQVLCIDAGEQGEKGGIVREVPFADIIGISGEGIEETDGFAG